MHSQYSPFPLRRNDFWTHFPLFYVVGILNPHSIDNLLKHPIPLTKRRKNLCLEDLGGLLLRVDLLAILVVSDSWGRGTVAAAFPRSDTDDLAVDGAGDAVLKLEIHLGDGVVGEDGGIRNITWEVAGTIC